MAQHKHADVLRAIADGKDVQYSHMHTTEWHDYRVDGQGYDPLTCESWSWRIKPEPKPDVVYYGSVRANGNLVLDSCFSRCHVSTDKIKLTFDGETGVLKSAEVLK